MDRVSRPPRRSTAVRMVRAAVGGTAATLRSPRTRRGSWSGALAREVLIRLGPVPVKFGQILGTRVDLVGEGWRRELGELHDRVPAPRTSPAVNRLGLDAAGRSGLEISGRVLGSGSIAVVYEGRLDGEPVAVKVRRAGVTASVDSDVAILLKVGTWVARLPPLRVLPVRQVVEQVADIVQSQVDLTAEADHLVELGGVADRWGVDVPQPVRAHSNASVMVTPLVAGLDQGGWRRLGADDRTTMVTATMNFVYDALFNSGIVHADLHPGNLYAQADRVVVVDGGMVFRLSEYARRSFMAFFLAFATGDGPTCAEIVWEASERPPGADSRRVAFAGEMRDLINRHYGRPAKDFSLITFSRELFDLQRRYGLRASPEFALPVLALLVVEGTVREHTPDLDFQQLAVPHLLKAVFALGPDKRFGSAIWSPVPTTMEESA